jgi:hypothetical protein
MREELEIEDVHMHGESDAPGLGSKAIAIFTETIRYALRHKGAEA